MWAGGGAVEEINRLTEMFLISLTCSLALFVVGMHVIKVVVSAFGVLFVLVWR